MSKAPSVRKSAFMGYPLEMRSPDPDTYGPTARTYMPVMEVLERYYGAPALHRRQTDLRAMARDNFPTMDAGRNPHTMMQPGLKPGDMMIHTRGITGDYPLFGKVAALSAAISSELAAMGVPMKEDEWRGYDAPDTAALAQMIMQGSESEARKWERKYREVACAVASFDSLSKFTIQRYTPKLWYVQDMSANHVKLDGDMKRALRIFDKVGRNILASEAGKASMEQVIEDYSDPFGTAVGWPLYSSSGALGEEMTDDAKLQILAMFEGVGDEMDWSPGSNLYQEFVNACKGRVHDPVLREFPLAYLVNRRSRIGGKWNPEFALMDQAVLLREVRGAPYARIAQAAPWLGNLLQGLVFPYFKAVRMNLTGCYHTKEDVAQYLEQFKKRSLYTVESDISAYDLNFAIEITDAIDEVVAGWTKAPQAALSILREIRRAPIVIPDPQNLGHETNSIFITGEKMLPSGIKLTAEYGTFGNVLVTIVGQLKRGMRETDIIKYWFKPDAGHRAEFLMQGDDKLYISTSLKAAVKTVTDEAELYPMIGCTAKVEMADRFLQKHMQDGIMTPVLGRFVQQRLGNEHEFNLPAQLEVGTMSAAGGFLNFNPPQRLGFDPRPGRGPLELEIQKAGIAIVTEQFQAADKPQANVIRFCEALLSGESFEKLEPEIAAAQQRLMAELKIKADADASAISALLMYIERNQYSATVASFIDDLKDDEVFAELMGEYEDKKRQFAKTAYKVLALRRDII